MARRHEWLRDRLDNWARWSVQRECGAQGWARESPFVKWGAPAGGVAAEARIPVDDVSAGQTHEAVQGLRLVNGTWWRALHCVYIGDPMADKRRRVPMGHAEIGRVMGVTDRAVRNWLAAAMDHLASALQRHEGSRGPAYPDED